MTRKLVLRRHGDQPSDRFGRLLVLLLLSLLFTGIGDDAWRIVAAVINTLMLVVAARATGLVLTPKGLTGVALVALAGLACVVLTDPDDTVGGIALLVQVAILMAIMIAIGLRVAAHQRVTVQTLAGALCVYVLLGLVFAWTFSALGAFYDEPVLTASAGDDDTIYYSFTTLTTVGFGDITSSIELVRRISVIEAMAGQLFLVTTVARLVSLFGTDRKGPLIPGA